MMSPMRRPGVVRTAALAAWALVCAGLTATGPASAAGGAADGSPAGGGAADQRVARIAAAHDRTPEDVRALLADPAVGVGPSDRLYYADPPRVPAAVPPDRPDRARRLRGATLPDVTRLHSRPGAARTILLDFDGHQLTGTEWQQQLGLPGGTYPAFSLDHDRTRFSADERAVIHEIWERVAEDFAPFDVDVTTRDPGRAALVRKGAHDERFGMRVLITVAGTRGAIAEAVARLCGGCVGLAWVDVFDAVGAEGYQPTLVFADRLDDDPWQIAETVSHEVGHTLGLPHAGDRHSPYHLGTPPWSPIMGAGAAGLTQWSRGEYDGAVGYDGRGRSLRHPVDEVATMAARIGGVRDDHGDTPADATLLGSAATLEETGLIGSPGDRDVFVLGRTCQGPLTVRATPTAVGTNLDIRLRVLDADGRVVRDHNPVASGLLWHPAVTGLDAGASLPSGTGAWYVEVSGGAQQGAAAWSGYGSLGAYRLRIDTCDDPVGPHRPPAPPPHVPPPKDPGTAAPEPRPRAEPPVRPQRVRVARGKRGRPRSVVVRWRAARPRGARVTAYVLRARKYAGKRVVARRVGRVRPGRRRVDWRLGPGVWRVRVIARSKAGRSAPSPWSVRVRAR